MSTSAKPAEGDLSFLGVPAPAANTAEVIEAAGQSKSNQLVAALKGSQLSLLDSD